MEYYIFPFLCFVSILAALGFVGFIIFRLIKGPDKSAAPPINAVNGRVYLRPEHRLAFLNVLTQIQQAPDRDVALQEAATTVESAMWLPVSGSLAEVQAIPVASTPQIAKAPVATGSDTPITAGAPPSTPPSAPVSAPVLPTPSLRWLAPDNITLLLYVGAALMVIAAGTFVAGSWDAIEGMVRFLIVAVFALAFLVVGELFINLTQRLRPAGTTFRAVGTLLLPFVALAYDRFVLEGNGPTWYWAVAGIVLTVINYAFYRFTNRGRLTAYLAVLSLGIFALALPPALGLSSQWTAVSLALLAGMLFLIMARLAPNGQELVNQLFRKANHPIAESHLIMGGLILLLALGNYPDGDAEGIAALFWALIALNFAGVALYFRLGLLAAVAAMAGGFAIGTTVAWLAPDMEGTFIPVALSLYAILLMVIAPYTQSRLMFGKGALMVAALFWAFAARSVTGELTPVWVEAITRATYFGLTLWLAYRYRNPVVWGVLWLVTNLAVIDTLILIPSESNSILIPSLLYLAVAALWLVLERVLPAPQSRYARISFMAQALWMTGAAYFYGVLFSNYIEWGPLSGALVLSGLTLGWLWMVFRTRLTSNVAFAIIQGALALPFILLAVGAPDLLVPVAWLAAGVILVGSSTVVPDFAKQVTERGGLVLSLVAPLGMVVAQLMQFDNPSDTLQTLVAQGTLLGGAVVYAGYGLLKRQRWAIGSAGALLYMLYAWVLNEQGIDEVQVYSVPLALLLFAYQWLFPAQRQLWEGLSVLVLIGIGITQAIGQEDWLYSALLGAFGVVLLVAGITTSRRVLVVGGVVGILFAALRQLWSVVAQLPPALIIGLAGLTFLLVAIVLLLTRDRWLKRDDSEPKTVDS